MRRTIAARLDSSQLGRFFWAEGAQNGYFVGPQPAA